MEKKLYRDELNKKLAGVCAGLADYLNVDVAIIRVCFVLATIFKGGGLIAYVVLWIALPKKPLHLHHNINVDYTVPPNADYNPFANSGVPPRPPFSMEPAKKSSGFGLVAGIVLVFFGSFFLLQEFNVFPDLDFDHLWPVALIIAGIAVIFSGGDKKPAFDETEWTAANKTDDASPADADATNTSTDKNE